MKPTGQIFNRIWISAMLGIGLIYFGFKQKLIHTTLRYYYIQPIGYIVVYFSYQLHIVIQVFYIPLFFSGLKRFCVRVGVRVWVRIGEIGRAHV